MENKCIICGAPLVLKDNRCQECKTRYCDLTDINFAEREPFVLKFKIKYTGDPYIITQYVKPFNLMPQINYSVSQNRELDTQLAFTALPFGDKENLLTLEVEDEEIVL